MTMADFTQARRALIDTEGDDEGHYLYANVPRRARMEDPEVDGPPTEMLEVEDDWKPTPVIHWDFRPTQPPIRHPEKPKWGSPWTQAILWVEAAVIILLGSIILGMTVVPWFVNR
jgi:hypothetical protein